MKVFCGHPPSVGPLLRAVGKQTVDDTGVRARPLGCGNKFMPELTRGASPGRLSWALLSCERHQGSESSQVRRARQVRKLDRAQRPR